MKTTSISLNDWLADVDRLLEAIDYKRTTIGMHRQPWEGWHANGLTPRQAFLQACDDQCIDPTSADYSAKKHAAKDAASDDLGDDWS